MAEEPIIVDSRSASGPSGFEQPTAQPLSGSVVGILPADRTGGLNASSRIYTGTLQDWQSEPNGLTVVAEVVTDPATVVAVSGRNVWGSFSTPEDALIVVAALARERPGLSGQLELTGVRMLAYEPRRRSARAGLTRPVRLRSGADTHEATTLDLSRGGCRVFTSDPGDPRDPAAPGNLAAGFELAVEVELDEGRVVQTAATVVRADGPEVALRFRPLAATDAAEVDAAVFRELVRPRP